jgi:hypothetical protein
VETIVTSVPEKPTQPITEPVSTCVSQVTVTPALIPSEYQDLYTTLEKQLNGFHDYLNANWDGSKNNVIYAAELITANGNRGEALLTKDKYFEGRKQQLPLIAREMNPDYLALCNEHSTEVMLTGLPLTPNDLKAFIQDTSAEIDRSTGILVGAGSSTWENPDLMDYFIQDTSLDFIDIHIYPLSGSADYLLRAVRYADSAYAKGKQVVIGEAGLYKATPAEIRANLSYKTVYARDVYSFWQPLDISFIKALVDMANYQRIDFVSFFWAQCFFAYLDYEQTPQNLSVEQLVKGLNRAESANIQIDVLSELGKAYQDMIREFS